MTAGLTPTEMHQSLDADGLLDDSHNSGVYAIRCNVPDNVEDVQRTWLVSNKIPLPDGIAEQLAEASRGVYVGSSGDIYGRLQAHAEGDVRKSAFVQAYAPVAILGVWPLTDSAFDVRRVAERNKAYELAGEGTVCWMDGELIT